MVNEPVSSARRRERFFDLRLNGGEVEFIEKLKVLRVVEA
jgi:hypothetical protein